MDKERWLKNWKRRQFNRSVISELKPEPRFKAPSYEHQRRSFFKDACKNGEYTNLEVLPNGKYWRPPFQSWSLLTYGYRLFQGYASHQWGVHCYHRFVEARDRWYARKYKIYARECRIRWNKNMLLAERRTTFADAHKRIFAGSGLTVADVPPEALILAKTYCSLVDAIRARTRTTNQKENNAHSTRTQRNPVRANRRVKS